MAKQRIFNVTARRLRQLPMAPERELAWRLL